MLVRFPAMVYADHAATTALLPEAERALLRALEAGAGNPSSLHSSGRRSRRLLEEARERCAGVLGVGVEEIVFTSGATEADNLAVAGSMRVGVPGDRILISALEHPAVTRAACHLQSEGFVVDVLPVNASGQVDPEELASRLHPKTRLVSIAAVNHELGAEQALGPLVARCRQAGIPLHCDAVQALPVRTLRPSDAGLDLLSVSGHKLGGAPGAGLLYVRRGLPLSPILCGGGQEGGRRAGTQNVPAILALAVALEIAARDADLESARLGALKARFEEGLSALPEATLLGGEGPRAPHISAWVFAGILAEALVVALDLEGIEVSSGAACSSHGVVPSPALRALGRSEVEALGLVRFSFGRSSTEACVDRLLEAVPRLVRELRSRANLTTQTGPSHPRPGVGGPQMDRRRNATAGGGFKAREGMR